MAVRTRSARGVTQTVLVRIPARMIDVAVAEGMNREALVEAAGLSGVDLTDHEARVPIAVQVALWQLIAKGLRDPTFGLRLGASFKVREAGLLGYVVAYSGTLEIALERLVRYVWVLNDAVQVTAHRNGRTLVVVEKHPERGIGLRLAVDYRHAAVVSVCRQITAAEVVPLEVDFSYPRRGNTLEHQRFFRCPLRFGQSASRLIFAERDLRLPVRHGDETLAEYLTERAEQVLRSLTTGAATREQVRSAIWNVLSEGTPTLTRIASALEIPPRTLQRRLAAEGTTLQKEVEEIRRTMAMALLRDRSNSTDEVAVLLGYAEPSTLFRSFRRWTGMTPYQYRETSVP
jgi:AraC-like DNA-binding protein